MTTKLEERLAALQHEHEAGQKLIADLDNRRAALAQTMLRIEGAITVLKELLDAEKSGKPPT